jgi:RNA polymerase sigma-70 factor (ECF subfamily)
VLVFFARNVFSAAAEGFEAVPHPSWWGDSADGSGMAHSLTKSHSIPLVTTMGTESRKAVNARVDERSLVRRIIAGDQSAFAEFADTYIPGLYRFASSRLNHDRELTREVVQATLVKAIAKLTSFRGEAALMTWLCACCKTEIATHFRRGKSRPTEVEWTDEQAVWATPLNRTPPDCPEESALRNEVSSLVHTTLDMLPPRYGQVLEWKYLDNASVKEIADRMSLRTKAAESLLTRARNSFREVYARLQMGPSHERE